MPEYTGTNLKDGKYRYNGYLPINQGLKVESIRKQTSLTKDAMLIQAFHLLEKKLIEDGLFDPSVIYSDLSKFTVENNRSC